MALLFSVLYRVPGFHFGHVSQLAFGFFCGFGLTHYYLDSRIWRVRHDPSLREALRHRRSELEQSVAADTARLDRIDERLRKLEGTATMSTPVEYRPMDAVTVYAVEGRAPGMGPENVSPVVGPLIDRLVGAIDATGARPLEPGIFWYEAVPDSEELAVHVSFTADPEPRAAEGYDVVELPPIQTAAVLTHHGDMPSIGRSWMALMEQPRRGSSHFIARGSRRL
jgi:hypothetical protein